MIINAVNQGNWSLSIKLRFECIVIVEYCQHYAKALTYFPNDSKIQGCLRCQYYCTTRKIPTTKLQIFEKRKLLSWDTLCTMGIFVLGHFG